MLNVIDFRVRELVIVEGVPVFHEDCVKFILKVSFVGNEDIPIVQVQKPEQPYFAVVCGQQFNEFILQLWKSKFRKYLGSLNPSVL